MSFFISEDEAKRIKDTFVLFDKNGDGIIKSREVGTVMRALGLNPLEAEVQDYVA